MHKYSVVLYSIPSTVQTLANWCCVLYTAISFIAKANKTPNVVVACSLITTYIVKAFIHIYREQLTTDSYQPANTSLQSCIYVMQLLYRERQGRMWLDSTYAMVRPSRW